MKKYEDLKLDILLSKLNGLQDYGLTKEEAEERLLKYGKNTIQSSQKKSIFQYVLDSFKDITIIILLVVVILSTYVALTTHPDNLTEPLVIVGIIILNIILSTREQIKAEKSMDALKEYNVLKSTVIRNGKVEYTDSELLVPGDIITLNIGDRVPADARIINEANLMVDESLLTGESEPVMKDASFICDSKGSISDRKNMIFSGTLVIAGKCTAIIT